MRLPKYDGRHWRILLFPCLNALYAVFVCAFFAHCDSLTSRLLPIASIPFGFSAFFYVGKSYALRELRLDLEERERERHVAALMTDLGIKEQQKP